MKINIGWAIYYQGESHFKECEWKEVESIFICGDLALHLADTYNNAYHITYLPTGKIVLPVVMLGEDKNLEEFISRMKELTKRMHEYQKENKFLWHNISDKKFSPKRKDEIWKFIKESFGSIVDGLGKIY